MSRRTNLSIATYTLGGTSFLGFMETSDLTVESRKQLCQGIADRYTRRVETKRAAKFNATHKRRVDANAKCQTMLTISSLVLAGGSVRANVDSGSITINTEAAPSDAGGDLLEAMVATGNDVTGSLTFKVPVATAATLLTTMADTNATLESTFTFTDAVGSISLPVTLESAQKSVPNRGVVTLTVTFSMNGTPTSTGGSGTLINTILAGTALVDLVWNDSEQCSGTALMMSATINFSNGDITREQYAMHLNSLTVTTP